METKKPFKDTEVGKLITSAVPEAGKIIGDVLPSGGVLGVAKNLIQNAEGVSADQKDAIMAKIEETQAYLADTQDARKRETTLRDSIGVWVQNTSAILVIVAFLGLLFVTVYLKVAIANKDMVNILLGALGTIVIQIFQYWFGSSKSSSDKNDHIMALINNKD